jgi:hypothetical protein
LIRASTHFAERIIIAFSILAVSQSAFLACFGLQNIEEKYYATHYTAIIVMTILRLIFLPFFNFITLIFISTGFAVRQPSILKVWPASKATLAVATALVPKTRHFTLAACPIE